MTLPARGLAGALLLLPACGVGPGVIGDVTATGTGGETDTDGATSADGTADGTDTANNCDGICDPDFAVSMITAPGFTGELIHLFGSDICVGDRCPETVSPLPDADGPAVSCPETEGAMESPVGAEEYCRFGARMAFATFVGFETPVDVQSFERTRPRPDNPSLEEPYLWHTGAVRLEGPGTAYRGDFHKGVTENPDLITRLINETCAERLTAQGINYSEDELEELCQGTWDDGGTLRPLRMAPSMVFDPRPGRLRSTTGQSCNTPEGGADTCCSSCDFLLSTAVMRYGVDDSGTPRTVRDGTAMACDPAGDSLIECAGLQLQVDRHSEDTLYTYAWDGGSETWDVPWYDKIRETHPDERPAAVERLGEPCGSESHCADGQTCIGVNAQGEACASNQNCENRVCRAEWFATCETIGNGDSYCVDRRFDARAAGGCFVADAAFGAGDAGDRLAECDPGFFDELDPAQCCDAGLGGAPGCDPLEQPGVSPIARYDRDVLLPAESSCACEEGQPDLCDEALEAWCEAPLGSASDPGRASPEGGYAVPFVSGVGGLRWEEDHSAMRLNIADIGNMRRNDIEACAEGRGLVGDRDPNDGWIANEDFLPELYEDHDLALCSGSTYRMIFADSEDAEFITSEEGGTLDGRSELVFETSQFRIVPNSLFPTDNLRIHACTDVAMQFSAYYDQGPRNLGKIELHEGSADGPLVAGGLDCDPDATPEEVAAGAIPCLQVDVGNRLIGELDVSISHAQYGTVMVPGTTYAVVIPGLDDIGQMSDPEAYAAAFHDACGMPLILGDTPEVQALSEMTFLIDDPCPDDM
ncbi:MAG: hypothetical protein AAF799_17255 [Myxococcota bacterium]